MDEVAVTQRVMLDRIEINELLQRYASAVAKRDVEKLAAVFTEDATFQIEDLAHRDKQAIRDAFTKSWYPTDPSITSLALDHWVTSTPVNSNVVIKLDGDTADCESYCIAIHAGSHKGEGKVVMRGTTNKDHLERTPEGWRIKNRLHEAMWKIELPGEALVGKHGMSD